MRALALAFVVLAFAGCTDGAPSGADMAVGAADLLFDTSCGRPGNVGNALGVGRFCESFGECSVTPLARICAAIDDPRKHFCTMVCDPKMPSACGDGATCRCEQLCLCTPAACATIGGDGGAGD